MATKEPRWRLDSLTLSGFRGFSKQLTVPINGTSALIHGTTVLASPR